MATTLQTVLQDGEVVLTSLIQNPFVEVTSVNGMTGDVTITFKADDFKPNTVYPKNSLIVHDGKLYAATEDFTSGDTWDSSRWTVIRSQGVQPDWGQTNADSEDYIKNKPVLDLQHITDNGDSTTNNVVVTQNDGAKDGYLGSEGIVVGEARNGSMDPTNPKWNKANVQTSTRNRIYETKDGNTISLDTTNDDVWMKQITSDSKGQVTATKTLKDRIQAESMLYFETEADLAAFLETDQVPQGEWVASVKEDNTMIINYTIGPGNYGGGWADFKVESSSMFAGGMVTGDNDGDTEGYPHDSVTVNMQGDYMINGRLVIDAPDTAQVMSLKMIHQRNNQTIEEQAWTATYDNNSKAYVFVLEKLKWACVSGDKLAINVNISGDKRNLREGTFSIELKELV